jgi:hypothetical protein
LNRHYANAWVLKQVFRVAKFMLGKKFIQRKKEPLFETGGKVSATNAVKCQGIRCESGTVAPL